MANQKISELSSLSYTEADLFDLFLIVDTNSGGTGLPETKHMEFGQMVSFFNSSSANVVQSLSQSVANNTNNIARLSASLQNVSASFVSTSGSLLTKLSQKLDNSLTSSYQAYGLPVLDSNLKIYSAFLPTSSTSVTSVFGRSGDVVALTNDYNGSQITFTPVGNISSTNVQAAIAEVDSEKFSSSGGTINGSVTITTNLVVQGNVTASNAYIQTLSGSNVAYSSGSFGNSFSVVGTFTTSSAELATGNTGSFNNLIAVQATITSASILTASVNLNVIGTKIKFPDGSEQVTAYTNQARTKVSIYPIRNTLECSRDTIMFVDTSGELNMNGYAQEVQGSGLAGNLNIRDLRTVELPAGITSSITLVHQYGQTSRENMANYVATADGNLYAAGYHPLGTKATSGSGAVAYNFEPVQFFLTSSTGLEPKPGNSVITKIDHCSTLTSRAGSNVVLTVRAFLDESKDLYLTGYNRYNIFGSPIFTLNGQFFLAYRISEQVDDFVLFNVGDSHALLISSGSSLHMSGNGQYGQNGRGDVSASNYLQPIPGITLGTGSKIGGISGGGSTGGAGCGFLCLTNNLGTGELYGWGLNANKIISYTSADRATISTPVIVDSFTGLNIIDIFPIGMSRASGLFVKTQDLNYYAKGRNSNGCLGIGNVINPATGSIAELSGRDIIQFYGSGKHDDEEADDTGYIFATSYALENDNGRGVVWSCGWNAYGQLGLGDLVQRTRFEKMKFNKSVKDLIPTAEGVFIVSEENELYYVGRVINGIFGDYTNNSLSIPSKVKLF